MQSARSSFIQLPRLLIAAAVAAAAVVPALPARAEVMVAVDRAKVMRVSRPADVVIIGNPAIADATVRDNLTLIITGHSFGSTNLIVLDAAGQAIAEEIITVTQPDDSVVTVYRRASRQTLSCTPDCSPTLSIGDNSTVFEAVSSQIQTHGTAASK
jgi:Flp pilus assembly secretin CpaC